MWRFRLLLLPLAAVAELLILASCWVLAVLSPARAELVMRWATSTLPSLHWYIGER